MSDPRFRLETARIRLRRASDVETIRSAVDDIAAELDLVLAGNNRRRLTVIDHGRLDGDDGAEWISRPGDSSVALSDLFPAEADGWGRIRITVDWDPEEDT